jgi:hypothetical protein
VTPELRKLLKAYVDAAVARSWKGGTDPAVWPAIEADMDRARTELFARLEELEACATAGTPRE